MSYLQSAVTVATWRDYVQLCKPRVVLLMLLTAMVGMCLAMPGIPPADLVAAGLAGIALVAGSAAVVNHVADVQVDRIMARTRARPVAQGRVPPALALLFSAMLGVAGMAVLVFLVNPLTALLNLVSWVGYGLVYTLFLKHHTSQNIVLGGLFGAAPPLFGWTAMTGSISPEPLLLVMIIFVWTPPHFWALALGRLDDYRKASVPMLPITHGVRYTRWSVMAYTVGLAVVSLLPGLIGMAGILYMLAAILLNARFVHWAIRIVQDRSGAPMRTFRYSIIYLGLLFLALLVDHYVLLLTSAG
ncbi:MAG: protoheme IX farnesyltransferase [Ectothiorhodospiraceae bacterium]|nr:protoheme IX farnesyltransferase [Ectothiorhodospiraceae bacterium]MCH8504278.1 heme o synthase [Ectothiorhodospiraceae bacterium]